MAMATMAVTLRTAPLRAFARRRTSSPFAGLGVQSSASTLSAERRRPFATTATAAVHSHADPPGRWSSSSSPPPPRPPRLPRWLSLSGRTVLVTGSSSGVGRSVALHLARLGARVLCADVDARPLLARRGVAAPGTRSALPTHLLIRRGLLGDRVRVGDGQDGAGGGGGGREPGDEAAEFCRLDVRSEASFEEAIDAALRLSVRAPFYPAPLHGNGEGGCPTTTTEAHPRGAWLPRPSPDPFWRGQQQQQQRADGAASAATTTSSSVAPSPLPRLDAIVNNAGVGGLRSGSSSAGLLDEPASLRRDVLDVNLEGVLRGCRLAARQMRTQEVRPMACDELDDEDEALAPSEDAWAWGNVGAHMGDEEEVGTAEASGGGTTTTTTTTRPEERGIRGSIVNIASIHGMVAGPGEATYTATKGAVIALTKNLSSDLAPLRIATNCVSPGYLSTPMGVDVPPSLAPRRVCPWPHAGLPRDVARCVTFLLRDASWCNGANVVVDGGTTAQ